MARFYEILINNSIYLSSDGAVTGDPIKLNVTNVEDLLTTVTGAAFPTIGGAVLQLVPFTKGKQFELQIETYLYKEQWDDLVALINDALENDTSFTVAGTGEIGDFTVTVKPFPVKPFVALGFRNGRIKGANFKFITV